MIGLDTNVLVRYFLEDDPLWSPIVTRFVDEELTVARPGYINPITLVELVWTLRRLPDFDRAKLAYLIENLLLSDTVVVGEAKAVATALEAFKTGGAGFADYLIAALNEAAGASPTMTIDRKAGKTHPFMPLSQGA
ncbi:type II toxin-antitoxin system VapC family toxin [Rhizobium sp. 32-5/1]|uniref:PIN domain-containing protein n=1 Tax=Rhizobium sp. 32-5/1 TaxID=3019602 RepID=UPI00240E7062|nr:type II toxin-antitoxin system VapC family toxin [Rhizobium sp. 32-5/1]WEZ82793.1 type II toxin-antitoxin system VapC family toxin [Rhizobium sp. 32-5/1]